MPHIASYNKKIAVMGAISLENGDSFWDVKKDRYFKGYDVEAFIKFIKKERPDSKVAIFWDQATVHKTRLVKLAIEEA